MKPRIVRERTGRVCLNIPWPDECPHSPEAVMAACERAGKEIIGVPFMRGGWWRVPYLHHLICDSLALTPEFMAEPKRCEHGLVTSTGSTTMDYGEPRHFTKCCNCGAILSDRRVGERRKGERRTIRSNTDWYGGRRDPGRFEHRKRERRQPHDR